MINAHIAVERTPKLVDQLTYVWERSVRATHTFLSEDEIAEIKPLVPQALADVETLVVAESDGTPVGFMGVQDGRLEMLFLDPDVRGRGLGRLLLTHGIERLGVTELTVNEQNPQAVGFYEHMGFTTYRRTETDEGGGPIRCSTCGRKQVWTPSRFSGYSPPPKNNGHWFP